MARTVSIRVEWQAEDGVWVATSDDLVGLVIQENTLDDCCRSAQAAAREMLAEYEDIQKTGLLIDFIIESGD
ncbi:MAG TPA: DUF1902 domain-containing protein [Alphaproteobacteria bacterium]|nr:DUF1902 domain-containing protein [Alphaproteobacteria bacterium]